MDITLAVLLFFPELCSYFMLMALIFFSIKNVDGVDILQKQTDFKI
jgi:hypothetical protein